MLLTCLLASVVCLLHVVNETTLPEWRYRRRVGREGREFNSKLHGIAM